MRCGLTPAFASVRADQMKLQLFTLSIAAAFACALLATAAEEKSNPIKEAMQKYHKAPRGQDNVSKKVVNGTATKEEIKGIVEGYRNMAKAKPPQGDDASWKEKSSKVLAAAVAVERGEPGALDKYKAAANCKACHDVHKPAQQQQ